MNISVTVNLDRESIEIRTHNSVYDPDTHAAAADELRRIAGQIERMPPERAR